MLTKEQHETVARAIRKCGLTQVQLAEAAGCSLRAVARLASYKSQPGMTTALMVKLFPVIGLEFTITTTKQGETDDRPQNGLQNS